MTAAPPTATEEAAAAASFGVIYIEVWGATAAADARVLRAMRRLNMPSLAAAAGPAHPIRRTFGVQRTYKSTTTRSSPPPNSNRPRIAPRPLPAGRREFFVSPSHRPMAMCVAIRAVHFLAIANWKWGAAEYTQETTSTKDSRTHGRPPRIEPPFAMQSTKPSDERERSFGRIGDIVRR